MSHSKLRSEKTCLNCGAEVPRHYCPECGQENVEPKQTLWHLVVHFFNDITHFDGKFFHTFRYLLLRPGHLSAEYVHGRRQQYLDPIRMYLFISAAFFILFSFLVKPPAPPTKKDVAIISYIDSVRQGEEQEEGVTFLLIDLPNSEKQATLFNVEPILKNGKAYYDSVQNSLPPSEREHFIDRYKSHMLADAYQNYDNNPYNFIPNVYNIFLHSFSKIFFISLPIFAFFLYVLYIRRRRQFYYVSHAIFTLHYYCVAFIFLASLMGIYFAFTNSEMILISWTMIIVGMLVYLYIAMLRFYGQHWLKTFIKFGILLFTYSIALIFLVIVMFVNSIATAQ